LDTTMNITPIRTCHGGNYLPQSSCEFQVLVINQKIDHPIFRFLAHIYSNNFLNLQHEFFPNYTLNERS
jgi:hypothetical protein